MHLRCWFARKMSQFSRFCGVKFLAWKYGCVKFLTNIMSDSPVKGLGYISPPKTGDTNEHWFVCKSAPKAIESGLIDVWKQWTYTAMKEEYLQVTTLVLWQIPKKLVLKNEQPRNIAEYPLSRQKAATKKWLYQKEQTHWVWDQGQHIIDFTRYDINAFWCQWQHALPRHDINNQHTNV